MIACAFVAALIVPPAIALACGPNRAIQLDRSSYAPGASGTVTGSSFTVGYSLTVSIEPGGQIASLTVPASGGFSVPFRAPSAPGSYVVVVVGYDENGNYLAGTPARQSFTVAAPDPEPAPPANSPAPQESQGAPAEAAPEAPASSAPSAPAARRPANRAQRPATQNGARPTGRRGDSRPAANRPSNRAVAPRGATGRTGTGSTGSTGTGTATATGAVTEPTGVVERSGQPVFAGSIARRERVPSAAKSSATTSKPRAGSADPAQPSARSANGDVWSGFGPSDGPSLTQQAGAPAAAEDGMSSALMAGVLLLGLGLLALAGGVAIAAARRRRA